MDKDRERKTSEARRRANAKWDAKNLKRFSVSLPLSEYDRMEEHISITKEKRNAFIRRSIKQAIERDTDKQ